MITQIGHGWLQNRLFSNNQPVLNKLVLGFGGKAPAAEDEMLENKQIEVIPFFDTSQEGVLTAIAEFTALDLENIKEIGLQADTLLISRDLFNLEIPSIASKIKVKYSINLKGDRE